MNTAVPQRSDDLDAMMMEDVKRELKLAPDKLQYLRKKVVEKRDLDQSIAELEEQVKQKKKERWTMERLTLPTLFLEARVPMLGLEAEGNQPACTYELHDYYHANISAEWDENVREDSFELLEKLKLGDLIKNVIEIPFGRGEHSLFKKTLAVIKKLKLPYSVARKVQWNTLTSAIKERYESNPPKPLSDAQLRMLGAEVGHIVKLKPPPRNKR